MCCVSNCVQRMADKTVDGGPWTGCAVMFLQSLCPGVNLLSLYKDREQGKFIVFKVIKLTLTGECSSKDLLGIPSILIKIKDPLITTNLYFLGCHINESEFSIVRFCRRSGWL